MSYSNVLLECFLLAESDPSPLLLLENHLHLKQITRPLNAEKWQRRLSSSGRSKKTRNYVNGKPDNSSKML